MGGTRPGDGDSGIVLRCPLPLLRKKRLHGPLKLPQEFCPGLEELRSLGEALDNSPVVPGLCVAAPGESIPQGLPLGLEFDEEREDVVQLVRAGDQAHLQGRGLEASKGVPLSLLPGDGLVRLAAPGHDGGDGLPEKAVKVLQRQVRVLQGVVKQTGRRYLLSTPGLEEETGYAYGVDEKRPARALAELSPVGGRGSDQGLLHQGAVVGELGELLKGGREQGLLLMGQVSAKPSRKGAEELPPGL